MARTLVSFRAWRVDTWKDAQAPRSRREFVLEHEARAEFNARVAEGASLVLLLKQGYADRSTRDRGGSVWNVVEEHSDNPKGWAYA